MVSLYLRGKANCDVGARAAAGGDWDLPAVGFVLLGTSSDRAMLQGHPRSPEWSQQLLTCHSPDPLLELGAATEIPSNGRRAVETHLHTSDTCTSSLASLSAERALLPARAAIPGIVTAFFHTSTRH